MKFVLAALMLVSCAMASAQSRLVSIDAFDLSYTGGLLFKKDNNRNRTDRDTTEFKVNLNYAQAINEYPGLMWRGKLKLERIDEDFGAADDFSSTYGVAGGGLYNFQADDVKNSIFAGVLVGVERQTYDASGMKEKSGMNIFGEVEGGKRFDLGSYSVANISYAPTISLQLKRYGGDLRDDYFKNGTELKLNFLKFDILF